MAYLESSAEHRRSFQAPEGSDVRPIVLPQEQKLEHLRRLPLFAGLLDEHYETRPGVGKPIKVLVRDVLLEHGEFFEVPPGTTVFSEGSFGEHLYFLLRGRAASSTSYALDADRTAK